MSLELVVRQLKQAKHQAERDLTGINTALQALNGKKPVQSAGPRRVLSAAARESISRAQKARWAKVRRNKKAA